MAFCAFTAFGQGREGCVVGIVFTALGSRGAVLIRTSWIGGFVAGYGAFLRKVLVVLYGPPYCRGMTNYVRYELEILIGLLIISHWHAGSALLI